MKPLTFTCRARLPEAADVIQASILDLERWPEFRGWGPLPGIASAEFARREDGILGTRIRVTNTDGSRHVEEITAWRPGRGLTMRLGEFSPPVSRLADRFEETWEFSPVGESPGSGVQSAGAAGAATEVVRSMAIYPRSGWARPVLWLVSQMLKRAIARHLREMGQSLKTPAPPI